MNFPAEKVSQMSLKARTSIWHLMLPVIRRALISPSMVDTVYHDQHLKAIRGSISKACRESIRHDGQVAGTQDQMSTKIAHRPLFTRTNLRSVVG